MQDDDDTFSQRFLKMSRVVRQVRAELREELGEAAQPFEDFKPERRGLGGDEKDVGW